MEMKNWLIGIYLRQDRNRACAQGTNSRGHTISLQSGPNSKGVYKAKWLGHGKTGSGKKSTFFPDSWTRGRVESAIRQAAGSAIVRDKLVRTSPNRWYFRSRLDGITNEGYLSRSKKTITSCLACVQALGKLRK